MKKSVILLLLILMTVSFQSCDSGNDGLGIDPDNTYIDFATITKHGQTAVTFSVQEKDDEPIATLISNVLIDPNIFPVNSRVLISYAPEQRKRYVDDVITLYSVQQVYSSKLQYGDITTFPDWDFSTINLQSLWRTGSYINIVAMMNYIQNPNFSIIVDKSTINNSYPELYLTYDANINNSRENVFYASIDVSEVWSLPTCRGLKFHLNNVNNINTITIDK